MRDTKNEKQSQISRSKMNISPAITKDYEYEPLPNRANTNPPNRIVPLPQFKIQHSKFNTQNLPLTLERSACLPPRGMPEVRRPLRGINGHQSAILCNFFQSFATFSNVLQHLAAPCRVFSGLFRTFSGFLQRFATSNPHFQPKK
jgi:hypothetical protein